MNSLDILGALNGANSHGPDLVVDVLDPDGTMSWFSSSNGVFSVGRGGHPNPDLRIRGARFAALALLDGSRPGHVAARELSVQVDGGEWALHLPFDIGAEDPSVPRIPNASVTVQHVSVGSPVGVLEFYEEFVDGRLTARIGGLAPVADVTATHTFGLLVAGYSPDISSLEAITGMRVDGLHRTKILLAAGLYDNRRLRVHLNQRSRENRVLVALAAHTSSPSWSQIVGQGDR